MTTRLLSDDWLPLTSAVSRSGNPSRSPQIMQATLAEYQELMRLNQYRQQLREELMLLLAKGANIEPGPLWVEIREQVRQSLSFAKLCAIRGERWAEDIRNRVEPTVYHNLIIRPNESSGQGNRPPGETQRSRRRQNRTARGARGPGPAEDEDLVI